MSVTGDHSVTGNCKKHQILAADLKRIMFDDPSDCIWPETPMCHNILACNNRPGNLHYVFGFWVVSNIC